MASQSTNIFTAGNPLAGFGAAILQWFETYAATKSRVAEIERLEAKTDAELADMGLSRDQIVRHVMRDLCYV